ncbi:MAG: hypothetical protein AAGN82_04140 [Myxococcota bacterium]
MSIDDLMSLVPLLFFILLVYGVVRWIRGRKKKVLHAQEAWALAVVRLGGHEGRPGVGATRSFVVNHGALMAVHRVFVDQNVARRFLPLVGDDGWKTQFTTEASRPLPPFVLHPYPNRGLSFGDPSLAGQWSVEPLLDAPADSVLAALNPDVCQWLGALPAGTYQLVSSGARVTAFRAGPAESEGEVEALIRVCCSIAGRPLPAR